MRLRRLLPLALLALLLATELLFAQGMSPFGRPALPPPDLGPMGWIIARQAEFYALLSRALASVRNGTPGAVNSLLGLSFLYGIFHAAGPGHGKAVISAYIVANSETIRRGVLLSFLSSLAQALVAIAAVSAMVLLFGATARSMGQVVRIMEIAGFSVIALIGARLVWTKTRALRLRFAAWQRNEPVAGLQCDDNCVHLPPAEQVSRIASWREMLALVVAVGARPCSGAILVLVFAASQRILPVGIAATFAMALGTAITVAAIAVMSSSFKQLAVRLAASRPGLLTVAFSAAEVLAAVLITLFGLGLLFGYLASERMLPF